MEKPLMEQIKNSIPSMQDVSEAASGFSENVSNTITDAQSNIKQGLDSFSDTKNLTTASAEFLNSNSILAKFAFLLLVLVGFLLLLRIGVSLIGYFTQPSLNPVLVKGALTGTTPATISQNPKNNTDMVLLSNNQAGGIEYTWSLWIFVNQVTSSTAPTLPQNIFVKGDAMFDSSTGYNLLNGPGVYLQLENSNYKLLLAIDTMNGRELVTVTGIPIQKWFHLGIRLKNKIVDTYINGVVTQRLSLQSVPKQNYNAITIHGNGGYSGITSNLTHYSYALTVFEINNIIMRGPNLSPSSLSVDSQAASGNYSYLSNQWYSVNT